VTVTPPQPVSPELRSSEGGPLRGFGETGHSADASRRLNVLQVCDHLGWEGSRMHGVKRLFAWMIPRFDPARYNVSLVSLRKKDLSEETLDALGIDITYLHKSKFDPATLPALLKVIDRKQIDVLHLHGYGATTFGRCAGMMRGLPTILHEHANLTDTPWFQKIADRLLAPATDIAIAVSKSTAEFVIEARQMPAERVKVVYLGVPLEEFSRKRSPEEIADARRELGVGTDEWAVGTVTRLHESKGNAYLVEAAQQVLRERPNTRFFVFGEGPLRADLESQARALGLGDRFVFGGFARDVARVLSAFDVSAFPSLWEGTPLTVFEALAMGKPIVSTDADGLLDVLTDGHDAVMAPRRDAGALASAIVRLSGDAPERARLAANAKITGAKYDIDLFVRKMERLYELLHQTSRATKRAGILQADLSFLTGGASAS
jgi:glycosyltransferase involved in cell wall biosynthesis